MKTLLGLCAIALFLSAPLAANANLLGTGYMDLDYSAPTGGGYYLDYDGKVMSSTFGYTTGWEEVFCVSAQDLHDTTFDFYTLTSDLNTKFGAGTFEKLSAAAWIADNWQAWGNTDTIKGEAQKAVWKIMGVMDITGGAGIDYAIWDAADDHRGQPNSNWYLAYSPSASVAGALDYQDYLTPVPVPEPSVLLIVGSGFAAWGAMTWRRRKN